MKSIALLGFALAMSPALAAAQTAPASDAAAMPRPDFAAMQQMHAQMKQIHDRARLQMLASLSPAHRAALANIIGQLAISANPDPDGAARSIDVLLSANERNSVLATQSAARTQERSMMESARAQFESTLTPDQKTAMQARMEARKGAHTDNARRVAPTPDAGRTLLELGGRGGMMEHRGFGEGPGGPPPQ